jgi:hypothetical protein
MQILINLSKLLKFNEIILLDQANKSCNVINSEGHNIFEQERNLRNKYLLQTGHTYYGTFGFRPIKSEDAVIYENINNIFKILYFC